MALTAYLVLLGLAVTCVEGGGPGRHFRGPLIHGRGPFFNGRGPFINGRGPFIPGRGPFIPGRGPFIPGRGLLPLIPLRPLPPPFIFNKGPRRSPVPLPFVNKDISDLAQPFPFTSYQTPFGGPQVIDNRAGVSVPLRESVGDFGFDVGSNAAPGGFDVGSNAAPGGFDVLAGSSASASAGAGVSGRGGLGGIDFIGGGLASAGASSSASVAGGLDVIGGGPGATGFGDNRAGFGDNRGGFDSGIGGGFSAGGDRRDFRDGKKISLDNGFDNSYDNGGRRTGLDNGYDNGRLRGSFDSGRDDSGYKYGRGDGFGSVVVDGGDTTIVHVSRPGDTGLVATGPGNVYNTRVTYDGGPDAFGTAGASASASAGVASTSTGGVGAGPKYDTSLIDFFPGQGQGFFQGQGQGQGVGTAAASASASATATSGSSGAGFSAPKSWDAPQAPGRQTGSGAYNPNIVVVHGNDEGKVKVVV